MTRFVFHIPSGTIEPGAPLPSADATHGNIGLQGPSLVMLRFTEPDGVRPSDSAGNLDDLAGDDPPVSADAWTGRGRSFDGTNEISAEDLPGRDTLSTRDVSLQAILSVADSGTDPAPIYQRGTVGAVSFGVRVAGGDDVITIETYWDTGGLATATFPLTDEFILLTVTRRWESTTRVVVRVYVGEEMIAEHVDTDGGIAGSTTAATFIGWDGPEGEDLHFHGVLDELRVADYELTHEEVRATWRRLARYQPNGIEMLRGLIPPGLRWMANPASRIGRVMRVVGQALGYAAAKAEELRETWLPDSGYREQVERWERIRGIAPRARDSLDIRRARLAALFRREHGYSPAAIREALAELFDQEPDEIELLEFTNETTDDFTTLDELRWRVDGTWDIATGQLRYFDDVDAPVHATTALSSGDGEIVALVKLASVPVFPDDMLVGLVLVKHLTRLYLGIRSDGAGVYTLVARSSGVDTDLETIAGAWDPAEPVWLRAIADEPGIYRVGYSLTGPETGFVEALHAGPVSPDEAGLAIEPGTATGDTAHALFDDFLTRTPHGARAFHWYAYRDPGLPGSPDMQGARAVVTKLKPAHTHGAAITTLSVLCDNAETVCDREPLGGI
jgi:hypothetical protein